LKIIKIIIILATLSQASFIAKLGINLGGTMPFPLPDNIVKVESYSPNLFPAIGAEALKWLNKKIGVSAGLGFENKGMKSTATVKEYFMDFGDEGKFTGSVDTEASLYYLGLPISAHYALMENFSVYAGAYYAYLLNGKFKGVSNSGQMDYGYGPIDVDSEKYDFSNELKNYDAGLSMGLNFLPYNEHILLSFDFNYGLVSIFQDMQNVYGKFSVGYMF